MKLAENSRRYRILLADDHKLVADACKKLLEPEFDVVGIVGDGRALINASAELKPDLIVADIGMPKLNGLDAGEQIMQATPGIRIVYLTMNTEPDLAAEAFRRGASGYLLKTSTASELVTAVRESLQGGVYISPQITKTSLRHFLQSHSGDPREVKLTTRQREVLQLLAEGHLMKQVAGMLNISTRTVAFHKYHIMALLGLKSNAELVQYAIRNSIISR